MRLSSQRSSFYSANTRIWYTAELQQKAGLYQKIGLTPVYDYSACTVKSDTLAEALYDNLKAAILPLENVPEDQKGWHLGGQVKVLDLVNPSLWPLVYGRTRVVITDTMDTQTCLHFRGHGQEVPKPMPDDLTTEKDWPWRARANDTASFPTLSLNFQWLPCDVAIGKNGNATISGYINNLHPDDHSQLYDLIAGFIQQSLPTWDIIYRWPKEFAFQCLQTDNLNSHCTTPEICRGDSGGSGGVYYPARSNE